MHKCVLLVNVKMRVDTKSAKTACLKSFPFFVYCCLGKLLNAICSVNVTHACVPQFESAMLSSSTGNTVHLK